MGDMNRTQPYLSRLGIFNYINIEAIPDTTSATPTLDVAIECTVMSPVRKRLFANFGVLRAMVMRNAMRSGVIVLSARYSMYSGRKK